ncbi:neuroligin-4, Y-linked [Trichonephila inaurata madagascariensis]|uniref:Neuroligin-4, Y-linked n=1 Tax=Trichonephila inaurata madagascariensis TaxID=2747483 RepID=A0A8X7CCV9_9ARAC|nr:neuroligin-4, Y-linked [Trichonephila inaurata madagascariensis]
MEIPLSLNILLFVVLWFVPFTVPHPEDNRFNKQNRYYSDYDGRRDYPYSNTEFDHAVDDDRCVKPYEIREIVKNTKYGNYKGREISLCDSPGVPLRLRPGQPTSYRPHNSVRVFLGIPYAEPPTRRNDVTYQLKPPKVREEFRNRDTFSYSKSCPQNEKYIRKGRGINTTDEDCLYLNIFSPGPVQLEKPVQDKHPVMFYIHGGNFDHGGGALFPGHMLAASQRVVVVTFNYRLGYLGFLATGDTNSPGNYGILDQIAALDWVKKNIDVFDGDPNKITVFGSGAGAACASLLAISPLSKHMIKRVIAQNGSPTADWAAISEPKFMINTSQILGDELGCDNRDFSRLVDCVGKRSNNEIKILKMKPRIGWLPWGPVLDNFTRPLAKQFLPLAPVDLLERGVLFQDGFAFMTGISRDAGASIFWEDYVTGKDLEVTEEIFNKKIWEFMKMYNYTINAQGIFDAIHFMYSPPVDPSNKTLLREAYIRLLTDRYYVSPIDKTLQLMLKNRVPTYAYVLNYTLQGYSLPLKDIVSTDVDYLLLSGAPFMNPKLYPSYLNLHQARWTEEDRNMSQFMMEAWANFAKDGNPTPYRLFNTILWKPINEKNYTYLNLNATNTTSTMITDYREQESRFWNFFLPFFIDREPPTLAPTLEPGVAELRVVTSALWGSVALGALIITITLVFCILYCRIRRAKEPDDLDSSKEIIVNYSASMQEDTPV